MKREEHLSTALYRETRGTGFFRVLAGKNAAFYVDVLDELERETSERTEGVGREEALALIGVVLERHPGFEFDWEAEGALADEQMEDVREKSRWILEYLLKCRWLEEPPRRDWRRQLYFDAHGAVLMTSLRRVAWPEAAVFTDKVTSVCAMLANEVEIIERPWQTVETCISNIREGLNELRAMQKSVQRFTRKQMEEETLKGNLAVVFDDYSEQISHSCYAALVRARLPMKLPETVRRIGERLEGDGGAMAEMVTEVLRRHPGMTVEQAKLLIVSSLDELRELLERVLPMADEIDRRTADFTRRSLARFRYLQDVAGERRTEIKGLFDMVNGLMAGKKLHQGGMLEMPGILLPMAKLPKGLESLQRPMIRREVVEQEAFEDRVSEGDRQEGLRDMEAALRESVSVQRANAFVGGLKGRKGEKIESRVLEFEGEKGLTDLIAVLLHAESSEAKYVLEVDRVEREEEGPRVDRMGGYQVERFTIIKKAEEKKA